ncbi:MAG: hypothetical protein U0T81_10255 [Saprospiraceae bacterium]
MRKGQDLKSSGINFAPTVLLQPVSTDAQALKLFGVREADPVILYHQKDFNKSGVHSPKHCDLISHGDRFNGHRSGKNTINYGRLFIPKPPMVQALSLKPVVIIRVVSGNEASSVAAISFFSKTRSWEWISIEGQNIILESLPNKAFSLFVYDDKKIIHTQR